MKKTIILASVAIATLFAFSSCQKETLQDNESTNGVRIITAEFENNATKTTLNEDGKTPEWAVGDVLRVLNATSYQDVTLTDAEENPTTPGQGIIKNGAIVIAIPETMTGTLYAVYPASVTTMESCSDGNISFTIPAVQDGSFASANICVAKSMEDNETNKDNLVFSNATSVLEFSQTASSTQVLRVAVTAANAIAGKLTASFGTDNKATISTVGLTGKIIYTTAAATAQNKYYVAVAPVETGDITFNYYKAEEEKSESKTTKTLALNKIYALTIPTEDYTNSYVSIGGKKWAKYNLGATTVAGSASTCYGDYFAWGATKLAYSSLSSGTFTFVDSRPASYGGSGWTKSDGFKKVNTPYYDDSAYVKYTSTDSKTVLESGDDAATALLGSGWRMPTSAEFKALFDACGGTSTPKTGGSTSTTEKGVYWCTNYDGVKGLLFCDGTNRLFFPAAGYGDGTDLNAGSRGYYWSSSLDTGSTGLAYNLGFGSGNVGPRSNDDRHRGFSVRPVSD